MKGIRTLQMINHFRWYCLLAMAQANIFAEPVQLGEFLIVSEASLKSDVSIEGFEAFASNVVRPAWKLALPGTEFVLARADRGSKEGQYALIWTLAGDVDRRVLISDQQRDTMEFSPETLGMVGPFSEFSSRYLGDRHSFTEYRLIGEGAIPSLPNVEVFGIHYIQVRQDRRKAFERFVVETVHPTFAGDVQVPGMPLLYFKAIRGVNEGSYIALFALESVEIREKYWPTGAPETQALKDAFLPTQQIARELGTFLVPDTYLKEDSGYAAAYYESLEWTDFVVVSPRSKKAP